MRPEVIAAHQQELAEADDRVQGTAPQSSKGGTPAKAAASSRRISATSICRELSRLAMRRLSGARLTCALLSGKA
jgi:hypothetical protein